MTKRVFVLPPGFPLPFQQVLIPLPSCKFFPSFYTTMMNTLMMGTARFRNKKMIPILAIPASNPSECVSLLCVCVCMFKKRHVPAVLVRYNDMSVSRENGCVSQRERERERKSAFGTSDSDACYKKKKCPCHWTGPVLPRSLAIRARPPPSPEAFFNPSRTVPTISLHPARSPL